MANNELADITMCTGIKLGENFLFLEFINIGFQRNTDVSQCKSGGKIAHADKFC